MYSWKITSNHWVTVHKILISWTECAIPAFLTNCLVIYLFFFKFFFWQLYLYDSTMIAPFPLLFFGGEISVFVEEGFETVAVDDFIKFKSPTRIANLVKVGNICWSSLFLRVRPHYPEKFHPNLSRKWWSCSKTCLATRRILTTPCWRESSRYYLIC